jgi:hypothetical protein
MDVRIEMKEYGGVMLEDAEADAMFAIERVGGIPIPKIPNEVIKPYIAKWATDPKTHYPLWYPAAMRFGFHAENGHIILLSFGGFIITEKTESQTRKEQLMNLHIKLPEECKNLIYLREFTAALDDIPYFINDFQEMERISVGSIKDPSSFHRINVANMKKLKYLIYAGESLEEIPEEIFGLVSLQYLNLQHNLLMSIPERICNLKSLWQLDITNNKIESIPECLADLPNLWVLRMEHNKIKRLPRKIELFYAKRISDFRFSFISDFHYLKKKYRV